MIHAAVDDGWTVPLLATSVKEMADSRCLRRLCRSDRLPHTRTPRRHRPGAGAIRRWTLEPPNRCSRQDDDGNGAVYGCGLGVRLCGSDRSGTAAERTSVIYFFHRRRARGGLVHPSIYGGIDRKRYIIETNGAGVALMDVDRDGWLDALVLERNAARAERPTPTNRLYRNKRDGTFEDITERAGCGVLAWSSRSAPATTTTTAGSICS